MTSAKKVQKLTDFHQADFCEELMYLQWFSDSSTSQVEKKFQNGNSVIEK